MKIVEIKGNNVSYDVYIGNDVFNNLPKYIDNNKSVLIITDNNVNNLYIDFITQLLKDYKIYVFNMGNAEENKSLECYDKCVKFAIDNYLDRHLQVIAFGGGAVGDFAGFFASTYKRGVKFINIPTTLLAHDSAVGGKVALNVGGVKNVIGTFYQPDAVFYYPPFLKTLNAEEVLSGFGEVFKHDLLKDGYILNNLIKSNNSLISIINNDSLIEEILYRCVDIKKSYIIDDIEDKLGIRQALNLGHTLAHAIEIIYHKSHGEAVLFGLCFDLYISNNNDNEIYYKLFKSYGYFKEYLDLDVSKITNIMKNDKKNKKGLISFVGLKIIGKPYEINLTEDEFNTLFKEYLNIIKNW